MSDKIHAVCPSCGQVNGVSTRKERSSAICGACKTSLFPGEPIALDDATFDKFVARSHLPVVVDFWAAWCGPCKMMAPQFVQAAVQMRGQVIFAKVDTERAQQVAARYQIRSIPTMGLFKRGRELARTSGAMQASQINAWLQQHM